MDALRLENRLILTGGEERSHYFATGQEETRLPVPPYHAFFTEAGVQVQKYVDVRVTNALCLGLSVSKLFLLEESVAGLRRGRTPCRYRK